MTERKEPTIGSFDQGYAPPASRVEDSGDPLDRPRKPVLAFLASILFVSLGFVYAGRLAWALGLSFGVLVLFAILGQTGLVQSVWGIWLVTALSLVWTLALLVLPAYFAQRASRHYRLKWYNRWYWYVLAVAVLVVPTLYIAAHKEQFFGFTTYRVPSGSMLPTIGIGDCVVADTRAHVVAAVKPGDVVSFTRDDQVWVRRIVAGPGQHVHIDAAGLAVDGKLQPRTHTQGEDVLEAKWMRFTDLTLGADEFYTMGDNRGNSIDSRTDGPLQRDVLVAKITNIYFAKDGSRLGAVE